MLGAGDIHDVETAGNRRHRESTGQGLAKDGDVGLDFVSLLCATVGKSEPGDDLIEYQERARCGRQSFARPSQKSGGWRKSALQWLDDDAGQVGFILRDDLLGPVQIVEFR